MKEEKKRQERSDGVGISRNTSIFCRDRFFLIPTCFVPSFRHRRLLAANKEARMLALEIPFLWETSEERERERERKKDRIVSLFAKRKQVPRKTHASRLITWGIPSNV